MILAAIFIAVGLVLLVLGGDYLVRGASAFALKHGVSALVVGLTVVAFGTSAPELVVSISSALNGAPGIAFGNVVGSNIANILLILGVPALIAPIVTSRCHSGQAWWQMFFVSILFWVVAWVYRFDWTIGLLFWGILIFIIWSQIRAGKTQGAIDIPHEIEDDVTTLSSQKIWLLILAGVVLLPLGAQLLVKGAVWVATSFGVSDTVIGLTIVAIGTSLPELMTSISAARQNKADVALGNVVGSNIFNILLIIGTTSFFGPLSPARELVNIDLPVMIISAFILAPFLLKKITIGRGAGFVMVAAYFGYLAFLVANA